MRVRIKLTLLCLFLTCCCAAQKRKPVKTRVKAPYSADEYFNRFDLSIDSAQIPYLYHKIYEWAGTKYKYAGNTKRGIDCSRFVCMVYNNVYCAELNFNSRDLWSLTEPVHVDHLNEGDLLFFKIRKNQISHVGVYLGKNKFAHASLKEGVTISDLSDPYYRKCFFGGGRLFIATQ